MSGGIGVLQMHNQLPRSNERTPVTQGLVTGLDPFLWRSIRCRVGKLLSVGVRKGESIFSSVE